MKRLLTLVLIISFITHGYSDPKKPKPKGCTVYSCTDWYWKNQKGLFDPHSIQWPLHYTGETFLDKVDGGNYDIDVVFNHYGKKTRVPLREYRNSAYHNDPWFLDYGLKMNEPFTCEAYLHDKPHWKEDYCTLVLAGYEDIQINFDGPGCSKIIREWTVIDWCKYEPNTLINSKPEKYALVKDLTTHSVYFSYGSGRYDIEHDGWYSFKQVIKVLDEYPPEVAYCQDIEVDLEGECQAKVWLKNKIYDTGPCPGYKSQVEVTVYKKSGQVVLTKWVNAKNGEEFSINLGYLPAGEYKIHYHVKDGCNNKGECIQYLKVIDKNPPHLICIQDLSTSINDEYGVSIWAKDFVHKVSGPCYDNDLTYSFAKDSLIPSLTFKCPDGPGIQELEVFVTASNGVYASCNVTLMVADHSECSDSTSYIAGKILNRYGYVIEGAAALVYTDDNMVASSMSNQHGIYGVGGIPKDYKSAAVTAKVADKSLKGVDAIDLIYMLRYIQGIDEFNKVEQKAAADINSDGVIDMEDYLDLVYLIYDIPGRDVVYEPWKFYEKDMRFSGITDPQRFFAPAKMYRFKFQYDFVGIKTGDLNFSWSPYKSARSRNAAKSNFTNKIEQGSQIIEVEIPELGEIYSVFIETNGDKAHEIYSVNDGSAELKYIFEEIDGKTGLVIMSQKNLSGQNISISANPSFEMANRGLLFETEVSEEGSVINWQLNKVDYTVENLVISPNPFDEIFTLSINAEESESTSLEIYESSGKLLFRQNWNLQPGVNKKQLDASLFRSGLYILHLVKSNGPIVKRIIKN